MPWILLMYVSVSCLQTGTLLYVWHVLSNVNATCASHSMCTCTTMLASGASCASGCTSMAEIVSLSSTMYKLGKKFIACLEKVFQEKTNNF